MIFLIYFQGFVSSIFVYDDFFYEFLYLFSSVVV